MNGVRGIVIAVVASLIVGFALGLVAGIAFMRFGVPLPPFALHGGGLRACPALGPMGMRGMGPGAGWARGRCSSTSNASSAWRRPARACRAALERMRVEQTALRDSTHASIERELTEEQRAHWRELLMRYQQSWRGRTGRPLPDEGRPPGGDPDPGEER